MNTTLRLSLSDELRAFVDRNSGDGTLYATASEFVCDVLREKNARIEADQIRDAKSRGLQLRNCRSIAVGTSAGCLTISKAHFPNRPSALTAETHLCAAAFFTSSRGS